MVKTLELAISKAATLSDAAQDEARRLMQPVHNLLSPAAAAAVEDHCASCPTCQTALESARRLLTAIQSVPASEASARPPDRTI